MKYYLFYTKLDFYMHFSNFELYLFATIGDSQPYFAKVHCNVYNINCHFMWRNAMNQEYIPSLFSLFIQGKS